jgi:alkanesulfonate monooxygenase SsuD/methylene tetrahydromethanopterin reductase-like flavin-dependent oxidoreductase (luciferase family)
MYLHAAIGPDADARLETERVRWEYPSIDGRAVTGDGPTVAGQVRPWFEAGVDTVVLQPTPDEPDYPGFLRFVARDVRPRLHRP